MFTTIDLAIELMVDPGQELAAEQLLRTAERACIVARALAVPVHVIVTFAAPHQLAAG